MVWSPLRDRLEQLPLILAGPILRHTTPESVTVWLALKSPRLVTLTIYDTEHQGKTLGKAVFQGIHPTVSVGQHLHLVAVTAQSLTGGVLASGVIYAYDLSFGGESLPVALTGYYPQTAVSLSYFDHGLPTFTLPPEDLNHLRIVHGSCRKPHGGGKDALAILDDLIRTSATAPLQRPQQLFLTGDQIYGDDVADPLLFALTDAGNTLLGFAEPLPIQRGLQEEFKAIYPQDLPAGSRTDIARDIAGLTAMISQKPHEAKSHLISLGEYATMYLFAWSPVLWPEEFPPPKTVHQNLEHIKLWNQELAAIQEFQKTLGKVRRCLANIATYMICDDHDVSDDWYLNQEWCNRVLSKPLGRRVVQNGLLSYALFQAWGNTPEQFMHLKPGELLLNLAVQWSQAEGKDWAVDRKIQTLLSISEQEQKTEFPQYQTDGDVIILKRHSFEESHPLQWHYTLRFAKHEVVVLDSRTWRGYSPPPAATTDPPMLLSPTAFVEQIQAPLKATDDLKKQGKSQVEVTFVVAPTNLVSLWIIDLAQELSLKQGKVFQSDVGDAWNLNKVAFAKLLTELFSRRDRIIILSGDIHYGGAVRLNYWSYEVYKEKLRQNPKTSFISAKPHLLAQLTSSAFKNAEKKTEIVHTRLKSLLPESSELWGGWNETPDLLEFQVIYNQVRFQPLTTTSQKPVLHQLPAIKGNGNITWEIIAKNPKSFPDWQYEIEWIPRRKAKVFLSVNSSSKSSFIPHLKSWFQFWKKPWFQEGSEVVGHSNLGLIYLQWSNSGDKAVIQDIFWRATWHAETIVYSRYFVPLNLEPAPPALRVLNSDFS